MFSLTNKLFSNDNYKIIKMEKFVRKTLHLPNEGKFNEIIKVNCI